MIDGTRKNGAGRSGITECYPDTDDGQTGVSTVSGLKAVAFGTSLTYRSKTTGGYLNYLPAVSGMTFDNQGIGCSFICTEDGTKSILRKVTEYTEYADKDVVLLEGFVNDWYYAKRLGAPTDESDTCVCGCVRLAINHVRTQNPDATVFLVLDHYGRNQNGVDDSPTAVAGCHTQFSYYEEIAKVGESLGVCVIRLYSLTGIGDRMTDCFIDNIHPNEKGARLTANAVWSVMERYLRA